MGRQAGALPYSGALTEPHISALSPAYSPKYVHFPLSWRFHRGAAGESYLAH